MSTKNHTETETHEGWANRETWAMAQWVGYDDDSWAAWTETAREAGRGQATQALREFADFLYDQAIKECVRPALDMFRDVGSLHRVHWDEIANFLLTNDPARP